MDFDEETLLSIITNICDTYGIDSDTDGVGGEDGLLNCLTKGVMEYHLKTKPKVVPAKNGKKSSGDKRGGSTYSTFTGIFASLLKDKSCIPDCEVTPKVNFKTTISKSYVCYNEHTDMFADIIGNSMMFSEFVENISTIDKNLNSKSNMMRLSAMSWGLLSDEDRDKILLLEKN